MQKPSTTPAASAATLLLAALLAAGLAGPVRAGTCLASGVFTWTGFATTDPPGGWTGAFCGPAPGDDFLINSPDDVVAIDGDVDLADGALRCTAGALAGLPGATLTSRDVLTIEGDCTFVGQGAVVASGRVVSEVTSFGTAPDTTTIDVSFATASLGPGDFIVFGDDDPADEAPIVNVHAGPSPPIGGAARASFEKRRWYEISSLGANQVTYLMDAFLASGGIYAPDSDGDLPYLGSYGHVRSAPTATTGATVGPLGLWTMLAFPTDVIGHDMDGTDQWVLYPESSGACPGWATKVLWTNDDAAGDEVMVAGDVSACDGQPRILRGVRHGDPVRAVRPFTLTGDGVGTVVWKGGRLRLDKTRLERLGTKLNTSESPRLFANCSFCIFAASASEAPDPVGSYIRDSELAFMSAGNTGSSGISISGMTTLTSGARFNGQPWMELTGFEIDGLYLHSTVDEPNAGVNGLHGLYFTGSKGVVVRNSRIERVNDDGIYVSNTSYPDTIPIPTTIERNVLLANIAEDNNSQESIALNCPLYGSGTGHACISQAGAVATRDNLVIGAYFNAIQHSYPDAISHRNVWGGLYREAPKTATIGIHQDAGHYCVGPGDPAPECGTTGSSYPDYVKNLYPADVRDDVAFLAGLGGSPGPFKLGGAVRDSVISLGNSSATVAELRLAGLVRSERSAFVLTHGGGVSPLSYETAGDEDRISQLELIDTLMVFDTPFQNWLTGIFDPAQRLNVLGVSLSRSFLVLDRSVGWLSQLNDPSIVLDIDQTTFATEAPVAGSLDTAATASVSRSCATSTLPTASEVFGSGDDGTNLVTFDWVPAAGSIQDFLAAPGDTCGEAAPLAVGLSRLGVAHLMLGDAFLHQLASFGSRLPATVTVVGTTGPACSDSLDNDGDGLSDLADPGCQDATDPGETDPALPCDDGIDNDGDGLVDLNDPGCSDGGDPSEKTAALVCDDGADNDGDGAVDVADWGCDGPTDATETSPILVCDDGVDNDGDGFVDLGDPVCANTLFPREHGQCQDGLDNDGKLGTDFDGGLSRGVNDPNGPDPQCLDPWTGTEGKRGCGLGWELALALPALAALRRRAPRALGAGPT